MRPRAAGEHADANVPPRVGAAPSACKRGKDSVRHMRRSHLEEIATESRECTQLSWCSCSRKYTAAAAMLCGLPSAFRKAIAFVSRAFMSLCFMVAAAGLRETVPCNFARAARPASRAFSLFPLFAISLW